MGIRGKVFTGARARIMLGAKQVGHATGVNIRESIGYQEISVLGKLEVASQEPTSYRVRLDMSAVTIVGSSMKELGYFPKAGAAEGSRLKAILDQDDLTLTVEDVIPPGRIIGSISGVRLSEVSWSIQQGNLVANNVSFVAVEMIEQSEM